MQLSFPIHSQTDAESPIIYGSGEATRDFVTVDDVASANVLALTTQSESAVNQVYNVASGTSISISELFNTVRDLLAEKNPGIALVEPSIQPIRDGISCIPRHPSRGPNPIGIQS